MQLLTAKPVTYLVNLSERDYIRKKNKWLPKIKEWVDKNNPGDLIIPFSVALEERLGMMSPEEQKEELEKIGTQSQLGKIMTVGYQSLHVGHGLSPPTIANLTYCLHNIAHSIFHGWTGRIASMDHSARHISTSCSRCDPHRL